jgi:adenylate cyclase
MATEIERKFLVDVARWQPGDEGTAFEQGYLSSHKERTVRVRIEGTRATLTIKGLTTGVTRAEYEYEIPVDDAAVMLRDLCERPLISKRRHLERYEGKTWEIDVFHGDNEGLVIAEIELTSESEPFAVPPWAIEEVSHDPRYYNANLVRAPYRTWSTSASR